MTQLYQVKSGVSYLNNRISGDAIAMTIFSILAFIKMLNITMRYGMGTIRAIAVSSLASLAPFIVIMAICAYALESKQNI